MRSKVTILVVALTLVLLPILSSCGAGNATAPVSPQNEFDLYDISVNVHTGPQANLKQPFTVSTVIASLFPFSSLSGVFPGDLPHPNPAIQLSDLLSPSQYVGSHYSGPTPQMCMIVTLQLDDPSVFVTRSPVSQEFTIVPGVTNSQTVNWTVIPTETFGWASVQHNIKVDVAFDAEVSCQLSSPSLLPGNAFHLAGSSHNTVNFATLTVVDSTLVGQVEFIDAFKTFVGIALGALLPIVLAGMISRLSSVRRRVAGHKGSGSKQDTSSQSVSRALWMILIGTLAFAGGLLDIFAGPSTVISFVAGVIVTLVSIGIVVFGVWRVLTRVTKVSLPSNATNSAAG